MKEMPPTTFDCPACRAPLRLRERRFIGSCFPCPECQTRLTLLEIRDSGVVIRLADELSASTPQTPKKGPLSEATSPGRMRWSIPPWLKSPVTVSWIVAISVAAILISLAMQPSGQPVIPVANNLTPVQPEPNLVSDSPSESDPVWSAAAADTTDERLQKLGRRINAFVAETGRYPHGLGREVSATPDSWSWIAELERQLPVDEKSSPALDSQKTWRDSANERFVRRQLPEFLRPGALESVGEQGYPTTHFVGAAGVGRDGPDLPVTHPRAGLFGSGRETRPEDVVDGLANTIAILGIEMGLGSWAEGSAATIRPLTSEPFIHGPDGFGTGPGDSMVVLMADGSVRTITTNTDPRLVRRMMALADRLPLDLEVPGEPGDLTAPPNTVDPQPMPLVVAVNPPDDPAVSALVVQNHPQEIPRKVVPDWQAVLAQRLLRFEQTRPATRKALLIDLEDLLGRKIVWQVEDLGLNVQKLDQPIQLKLTDVTVAEILNQILADTDLSYQPVGDEVHLIRTTPLDPSQ